MTAWWPRGADVFGHDQYKCTGTLQKSGTSSAAAAATHDGSWYSSPWIDPDPPLLLLLSTCWSEFALLKASVNSRDTPVSNYPLSVLEVVGILRSLIENTHSWKPWQNFGSTVSVIPRESQQLLFILSDSWVVRNIYFVPIGFVRIHKTFVYDNYGFVTDATLKVRIKIGAFQETHPIFCQMSQENENYQWKCEASTVLETFVEALRAREKLLQLRQTLYYILFLSYEKWFPRS